MGSPPILYQDFVEQMSAIVRPTTTPNEPHCFICNQAYGSLGPGLKTDLDLLSELPGAVRCRAYVQHVIEPVTTPCGHSYCTYCIATWLNSHEERTCPMCRAPIEIPEPPIEWVDDDDPVAIAIEGLRTSLHISPTIAQQIFDILKLSMRQIFTTDKSMSLIWKAPAMVSDLPKIMVAVARRFNREGKGKGVVPADLPLLPLHNPMNRMLGQRSTNMKGLAYFLTRDAPLARHLDAQTLFEFLRNRIEDLEKKFEANFGCLSDWKGWVDKLCLMVREEMPDADGGVKKEEWQAYVRCVVKALLVWQAYCEHVQKLTRQQVFSASIEGHVLSFRLG